jgi:hypothetical protein
VTTNLYVDETKAKGYLVVVATIGTAAELTVIRKEIKSLLLPSQRSLHMKDEHKSRQATIMDTIATLGTLGVKATIYDAGKNGTERVRRANAIEAMIDDVCRVTGKVNITFDLDQTIVKVDRMNLIDLVRKNDLKDRVRYRHAHRHDEMLLGIPDAIAWCWARGGGYRDRVRPIVKSVRAV